MPLPRPSALLLAPLLPVLLLAPATVFAEGADGRFSERSSRHFLLRQDVELEAYEGPRGTRAFERELLEALERGHEALARRLGIRAPHRLEVHVWDPDVFDRTFAGRFRFPAAGFTGGTIHVRGARRVGVRLRRTLHHELVHATLDAVAPGLALPAWLNEGLAEWFESRLAGEGGHLPPAGWSALTRAARRGELPPLEALSAASFARLEPQAAGLAYLYGHGLVDFLARQRGEETLRRLLEDLARTRDLERSFRRAAKLRPEELDAAFRRELGAR